MKIFFRKIHLYLGLIAGIVIIISCITGSLLVFEKEFQSIFYKDRYEVAVTGSEKLPVDELISNVQKEIKGARVVSVKVYSGPEKSVQINYTTDKKSNKKTNGEYSKGRENKSPESKPGGKSKENLSVAFVNPYTGKIITSYSQRNSFFNIVLSVHRTLLSGETGKLITGTSTFIFLFILITGIILWWPANYKILKQRITVKWSAGWKRLNHDFHLVFGFYASIILFISAFTGITICFKWMSNGIFLLTGSESKRIEAPHVEYKKDSRASLNLIIKQSAEKIPDAEYYSVNLPDDSLQAVTVNILPLNAMHEKANHQLYFDRYTGDFKGQLLYNDRNTGQKVKALFYSIHVGSIGGMLTKIIAFVACIAGITLPVTGIILWLNRLKKSKPKVKEAMEVV